MNIISVLFFLVDLCFYYLFIHESGKLRVMCGIPLIQEIKLNIFDNYLNKLLYIKICVHKYKLCDLNHSNPAIYIC